ncbi:MAG: sigma-54-dependent Fis family transcriptional regulator [Magnetococcales bacterium]|nr:sigma-54-dependent Fis family transcriptional regulator [Magnetococcales bacterium]MBF0261178.1 sigma-54-dependent Fis family transcriptional regulator [Magnetococcales bacterium]
MNRTILIIDDEEPIRTSLRGILEDEEYPVLEAASGEEALAILEQQEVAAIMLDIWMTGIDGIETLRRIKAREKGRAGEGETPVIMMSGHGTIETAVSATKEGAYDFLEKPLSLDRVLLLLDRAIRAHDLARENRALKAQMESVPPMIGDSPAMCALEEKLLRVAPTEGWVLITGDNGTGKEVAARRLHALSNRAAGPFIAVNSAAIPEESIEVELFGQESTTPNGQKLIQAGRFEQSNRGTLFLDSVGDMSLKTQAKILRALQERRFERVGGRRPIQVDVRVIAATNKDLQEEIDQGRFRLDLYYRLNVIPIAVPPLKERLEDIKPLVEFFIKTHQATLPQHRTFSPAALTCLKNYHWPGNVRELKNLVERMLIMAPGTVIDPEDLPEFIHLKPGATPSSTPWDTLLENENLRDARVAFERIFLKAQLARHNGNISRTAEVIGMERSALHRKLKTLGLD